MMSGPKTLRVKVVGHVCLDLVPSLASGAPAPGSLVEVGPFETRLGGCVANTGAALAALGAHVEVATVIGADMFGDTVEALLRGLGAAKVDAHRMDDHATSYSIVLDPPGENRSFLHHVGANEAFDGRDIALDHVDVLHVGYPQILPGLLRDHGQALTQLLSRARDLGITTSVDFATIDPARADEHDWAELLRGWAPLIDVFTPSVDDLVPCLGGPARTPAEVAAQADELIALGIGVVLVTVGDEGMMLRTARADRLRHGGRVLTSLAEVWSDRQLWAPPADVEVTRTTAAGDTASAGLLYGLVAALSPESALRLATGSAALHCAGTDRLPPHAFGGTYDRLALQPKSIDGWSADGLGLLHGAAEPSGELDLPAIRARTARMLQETGIALTPAEIENIEVAHFDLGRHEETGLQLVIYVNTERCCAKELILFPGQTCPEHYHPPFEGTPGKEETFRVRSGTVYLYVPGEPASNPVARPYRQEHYTAWHEIKLEPGGQYTIPPMTKHWFYAPDGAIVSEFSTQSRDEFDVFTDPAIVRVPENSDGSREA